MTIDIYEKLNQINTTKFGDVDIGTLLSLCASFDGSDAADKFLLSIIWSLGKVTKLEVLLPAFYVFYFNHILDIEVRNDFYKKLREQALNHDNLCLEQQRFCELYYLANTTFLGDRSCPNKNLLAQDNKHADKVIYMPIREISICKLTGDWCTYYHLFGFDFLNIVGLSVYGDVDLFIKKIQNILKEDPYVLWQIYSKFNVYVRRIILKKLLAYYIKSERFEAYISLLVRCPTYLNLLKYTKAPVIKMILTCIHEMVNPEDIKNHYISYLINKKIVNVIIIAAEAGMSDYVQFFLDLIEKKQFVNKEIGVCVATILKKVAEIEQLKVMQLFLNLRCKNEQNRYFLVEILRSVEMEAQVNVVQLFLEVINDHNSSCEAVSNVLKIAAAQGQFNIVRLALDIKSDNRPNYKDIAAALEMALDNNHFEIVRFCLNLTGHNKLNSEIVSKILNYAADMYKWIIVREILAMTGENKPNSATVSKTLVHATLEQNWDIAKLILVMTADNKPNSDAVDYTLRHATQTDEMILYTHMKLQ